MAGRPKKTDTAAVVVDNVVIATEEVKSTETVIDSENTNSVIEKINSSVEDITGTKVSTTRKRVESTIQLEEEIACKSITYGGLTWISPKTNSHYHWNNIGDVEFLTFSELVTLNNTKRDFLFKPMFIVQDERVVEYFRLDETYLKVARIHELDSVVSKGNLMEVAELLTTAINVNMRDVVISKLRQMRRDGVLTNIDVIKLVENKLKFDLSDDDSVME